MKARFATIAAAALISCVAACDSSDVGSDESNVTEWATSSERNKAYNTKYIIEAACNEIYGAGSATAESCKTDHAFTLIESRYSTKYGYLKAIEDDIKAPLEVGQTLTVESPAGASYKVTLLRQFDEAFHLRWTVLKVEGNGDGPPPADIHEHIENVADELGEYVDFGDSDDVVHTTWESFPEAVQLECESQMLMRAQWNSDGDSEGYCAGSADWADGGFGEIKLQGETVGYVCGVWDVLDNCPLWDGSGAWFYLDTQGEVVVETNWTG